MKKYIVEFKYVECLTELVEIDENIEDGYEYMRSDYDKYTDEEKLKKELIIMNNKDMLKLCHNPSIEITKYYEPITNMGFDWKCAECQRPIIVPYESPNTMSSYACPLCPGCYYKSLLDSIKNDKRFDNGHCTFEYLQENGAPCYQTPDEMYFLCELI